MAWRVLRETGSQQVATFDQLRLEARTLWLFFRHADRQALTLPEDSQRLRRLLEQLMQQAPPGTAGEVRLDETSWPPTELLSLMALGQHYGLPTRLIDWSWNSHAAAYFAATGASSVVRERSRQGAPEAPTHLGIWALNVQELEFENAEFWEADGDKVEVVTAPAATNANLAAQRGLFTLVRRSSSAKHVRREPLEATIQEGMVRIFGKGGGPNHAQIVHFRLPVTEAPALLTLLARDGVTAAEIFPGYDGVVQSLKERDIWVDLGRT